MISLFLDTCSEFVCLVLFNDRHSLEQVKIKVNFNHSEQTPELVDQLLKRHHLTWMQVAKIYLTTGPGYYSGIRVGVTIAKTCFLVNNNVTIYVLSSLQFLAGNSGHKISCVWVTKKILFYQLFANGQPVTEPVQTNDQKLKSLLLEHNQFRRVNYASLVDLTGTFCASRTHFARVKTPDQLEPNYLRTWHS